MSFNTLLCHLRCPHCQEEVASGVGFRLGVIEQHRYQVGDRLNWQGPLCRPKERPSGGNIKSIGYYNCDNLKCPTWQDCYPQIQYALITVENDIIKSAEPFLGEASDTGFDIIEPEGLS